MDPEWEILHRRYDSLKEQLFTAAAQGDAAAIRALLVQGAPKGAITTDGKTALHLASEAGHTKAVKVRPCNHNQQFVSAASCHQDKNNTASSFVSI